MALRQELMCFTGVGELTLMVSIKAMFLKARTVTEPTVHYFGCVTFASMTRCIIVEEF